jgi:biopolymer transport protein ExbD
MDITSPYFVVPLIAVLFAVLIFFATSTKEDGPAPH